MSQMIFAVAEIGERIMAEYIDYGTHYCDILRMACPDDSEFYCSYGEREENNGVD